MEGGRRREIENEEAGDREELFSIGAFLIAGKSKEPRQDNNTVKSLAMIRFREIKN
jgi:hypothetical protein